MAIYTVHESAASAEGADLVLVREGFAWPAFLLTVLWALWYGLWRPALGYGLVALALYGVAVWLGLDPVAIAALAYGYAAIFGSGANDMMRRELERRGYRELGVVWGESREGALQRSLALAPTRRPRVAGAP